MAVRCPDGGDAVSATAKGLGPSGGSGFHTPAYGDVTGVLRRGSDQARSTAGDAAPARGSATAEGAPSRAEWAHRSGWAPSRWPPTRSRVLADAGWDVERDGLVGAPRDPRGHDRGAARDDRPVAALAGARRGLPGTGLAAADSWGTDGHERLNVPYDSGYAFCADPEAHRAAMAYTAASLTGQGQEDLRAPGTTSRSSRAAPAASRRGPPLRRSGAARSAQRRSGGTSGTDGRKQDRASRPRPIPTPFGQVMAPTGASCRGIDGTPAPVHAHMVQW